MGKRPIWPFLFEGRYVHENAQVHLVLQVEVGKFHLLCPVLTYARWGTHSVCLLQLFHHNTTTAYTWLKPTEKCELAKCSVHCIIESRWSPTWTTCSRNSSDILINQYAITTPCRWWACALVWTGGIDTHSSDTMMHAEMTSLSAFINIYAKRKKSDPGL